MSNTTAAEYAARAKVWGDRVRAARAQQKACFAAASAYLEMPTPGSDGGYGDPWFSDYRRALANAENDKADAAGQYAEQAEAVVSDLLDKVAAAEINAESIRAAVPA